MDTRIDVKALLSTVPTGLWIGGEERAASSTFDVLNPATDEVLIAIADATPEDGIAALDAAAAVQGDWAATPPRERGEILRSVFEAITARAEEFATLMTLEMGKVLAESMGEVKYGAEFFRWFAEEAVRIGGRYTKARRATAASSSPSRRSDRVWRSRRGTSRWRWAPARSDPRWPPAARWSSSPRRKRR